MKLEHVVLAAGALGAVALLLASRARTVTAENTGFVTVTSDPPGATVYFDSMSPNPAMGCARVFMLGETPFQKREVCSGKSFIWIEKEGYYPWSANEPVTVFDGQELSLSAKLFKIQV